MLPTKTVNNVNTNFTMGLPVREKQVVPSDVNRSAFNMLKPIVILLEIDALIDDESCVQ